jgi:hypothetical protein
MPVLKRTKADRAPTYAKTLALESALPRVIEEQLNIPELAKLANVHTTTANRFLARKAEEYAAYNRNKFLGLTAEHATTFNQAAERQMEWLAELNAKPRHRWTEADFKVERHALACLKSLTPFLELAAVALRGASPRSQGAQHVGESPTESEPEPDATLSDGL